jgi:hypothetical protein
MRRLGLYAALALAVYGLPATAAERFGQWSLEQPGDFVFALSFKRSLSSDDRTATSELAFVCNQEEKYVVVPLIQKPAKFASRCDSEDRGAIRYFGFDAALGKRTQLYIFGVARRAGGTRFLPQGQRSRRREIGALLFPK